MQMAPSDDAICGAWVNAVVHGDFCCTTYVPMYVIHNRLKIVTAGRLPLGMRDEELKEKSATTTGSSSP